MGGREEGRREGREGEGRSADPAPLLAFPPLPPPPPSPCAIPRLSPALFVCRISSPRLPAPGPRRRCVPALALLVGVCAGPLSRGRDATDGSHGLEAMDGPQGTRLRKALRDCRGE